MSLTWYQQKPSVSFNTFGEGSTPSGGRVVLYLLELQYPLLFLITIVEIQHGLLRIIWTQIVDILGQTTLEMVSLFSRGRVTFFFNDENILLCAGNECTNQVLKCVKKGTALSLTMTFWYQHFQPVYRRNPNPAEKG